MQSTVAPFGASVQTRRAPANVAPAVMPTKIPSFCAKSRLRRSASAFWDRDDAVDNIHFHRVRGQLRNEIGGPALQGMGFEGRVGGGGGTVRVALLRNPAFEQRCVLRFAHDDLGVGTLLR